MEDEESDMDILYKLLDLIPTIAKHLLNGFAPILREIYPLMLKYLSDLREVEEHTQTIGMFACFLEVKPVASPFMILSTIHHWWNSFIRTLLATLRPSRASRL